MTGKPTAPSDSAESFPRIGIALALTAVVTIRLAFPTTTPLVQPDEGTWPMGVRQLVSEGRLEPNFATAPLYHLLLSVPFFLFGPSLLVGRLTSACFGLVNLGLTYAIARRLTGSRDAALWAALLIGVSFPAMQIDRRALVEPMQMTWLLTLVLALITAGRRAAVATAAATAALLLTKAMVAPVIAALGVASLVEWRRSPCGQGEKLVALVAGVAIAAAAYGAIWWLDPELFARGWGQKLMVHPRAGPVPTKPPEWYQLPWAVLGRVRIDPYAWERRLRDLSSVEPVLVVLGALGAVKALSLRQAVVPAWCAGALGTFFLVGPLSHHVAPLLPALAIGAGWFLVDGPLVRWRRWSVIACFLFGLGRTTAGLIAGVEPARRAIDRAAARPPQTGATVASPKVAMQLPGKVISMFDLGSPYLLTCPEARELGAGRLVIDDQVWLGYLQRNQLTIDSLAARLATCTSNRWAESGIWVFDLMPPTESQFR